jgi:hypothetical protein
MWYLVNISVKYAICLIRGLCCLTPLSTIFELYRGGQFYWRKSKVTVKNPLCSHSTNMIAVTVKDVVYVGKKIYT